MAGRDSQDTALHISSPTTGAARSSAEALLAIKQPSTAVAHDGQEIAAHISQPSTAKVRDSQEVVLYLFTHSGAFLSQEVVLTISASPVAPVVSGGYGGGDFVSGDYGMVATPFPATLKKPAVALGQTYEDPAIKSKMENGLVITRPRTTKVTRTWTVTFDHAPQSDAELIDTFVRTTTLGGSMAFLWTDPRTGEEVSVRFSQMPQVDDAGYATQKDDPSVAGLTYNIQFELEEI